MGSVVSSAAVGIGGLLGNTVLAPFKSILNNSCEDVCSGAWDLICFIQHLCLSDMLKLMMILSLAFLTIFFFFLLMKIGVIKCMGKIICKMSWSACQTYWSVVNGVTCFLWHKLKNTKRVDRRRHYSDVEDGHSSSDVSSNPESRTGRSERKSVIERRRSQVRSSLQAKNQSGKTKKKRKGCSKPVGLHTKKASKRRKTSHK